MRKTNCFLVFLPLFIVIFTFSALAKDDWLRVNSKNFHLIGNASEKNIRKVATRLEQFRESFRILFTKTSFDGAIPTNVIVFKSDSAYKPFKPKKADGKIDNFVAGYFQPGRDVNYITLSSEGEGNGSSLRVIFHEYVHFILNTNFGKSDIPTWFNEGLAEYYETYEIENDQTIKLGIFQERHLDLLSRSKLVPLDTLFNTSNEGWHQSGDHSRSILYAESWALIHYLMQSGKGEQLGKFLNSLVRNIPAEKAFQDAFQMDYSEMEKELKKYIYKSSYQFQIYTLKQKLVFDSEMKVSPLSEADSNAYLGDLLLHTRRVDDAEEYLLKALSLDPKSSLANTALGMVKYRQRKFAEARKYLEAAITDDQKNYFALYNFAYLLSRERQDEFGFVSSFPPEAVQKMREALKKAIALNPAYTESYELLAFISLVNNENLDEAVELLKKSLTYQPNDQETIIRIAEIYARQQKFAEAKQIAEKFSRTSDDPIIKSRADNLLNQIKTREMFAEQNAAMEKQYQEQQKRLNRREPEKTPEEIAKMRENEEMLSINQALKKPAADEKQVIGKITKISCVQKTIVYSVKTETGTLSLFSNGFQNLALVAFDSKAEKAQIGCNANLTELNSVLTYKTSAKSNYAGELMGIDFVPANFRFMKESDVQTVSKNKEEPPPTDSGNIPKLRNRSELPPGAIIIDGNTKPEDIEAKRREMMMQALRNALRQPQEGETRLMGMLESIECDSKGQYFVFRTENKLLKLKPDKTLQIKAFTPDAGGVQFQCGQKNINLNSVITYKLPTDKKAKFDGDLVALELVPNSFKLE